MRVRLAVVALAFTAIACSPGANPSTQLQPDALSDLLSGTAWTAVTVAGVPALPAHEPSIEFDDVGIRGSTGCNEWGGQPTFGAGGAFTIAEISMTKRACENAIATQESAFLTALRGATSITLDGQRLIVRGPGGEIVLRAGVGIGGSLPRA